MIKPELMAPAGNWVCLRAAVTSGADAVYLGVSGPSMRNKAGNFSLDELDKVVDYCHRNNVKVYVTVNSIVYEWDLKNNETILKKCKDIGVDSIICWDVSVIKKAKELGLNVHLSTQASVSNSEAIEFYKMLGIDRVVLARECSLEQIQDIIKKTNVEVEVFIHGAMCMAISGRCFLSQFTDGRSANRGVCVQNCRREYTVIDDAGNKLKLGNDYILSAEDLCALPFIEKLIESGVRCFKIEGRNKGPEYVKKVTEVYRETIDFYFSNKDSPNFEAKFKKLKEKLMLDLKDVYNRGLSSGFFLNKPINNWNNTYGSKSVKVKKEIGRVEDYLSKKKVAILKVFSDELRINDTIFVIGNTTGILEQKIKSMEINGKKVNSVKGGQLVGLEVDNSVRSGDKVFLWQNRKL